MPKRKEPIDVGHFPDPTKITAGEAMLILDEAEAEAAAANKAAEKAKARKAAAKAYALQKLEMEGLEAAAARTPAGKRVTWTPYEFRVFKVDDPKAFREWAEQHGDENYFDEKPREQVIIDEMRRRFEDGEPLPPGISTYTETRISRTAR